MSDASAACSPRSCVRKTTTCTSSSSVGGLSLPSLEHCGLAAVDTALVLVGKQGKRKSTFFATLGGEWFSDDAIDLASKDAFLQIARAWIIEWGEIEHVTGRRHAGEIKGSFRSASISTDRRMVAPRSRRRARACRRQHESSAVPRRRDGLAALLGRRCGRGRCRDACDVARSALAEAVALLESGERWWLEANEDLVREERAERHRVSDPWEPVPESGIRQQPQNEHTSAEVLSNCRPFRGSGSRRQWRCGCLQC